MIAAKVGQPCLAKQVHYAPHANVSKPGRWWLAIGSSTVCWRYEGEKKIRKRSVVVPSTVYTCGHCGTFAALDDHAIDDNGYVEPQVVCPACLNALALRLVGWTAPIKVEE